MCEFKRSAAAAVFTVLMGTGMAAAVPLTWTLEDVTFVGGGTAMGSFVYDADANLYGSVSIITSVNGDLGISYSSTTPLVSSTFVDFIEPAFTGDATGSDRFFFALAATMTNLGGSIALTPDSLEGICSDPQCDFLNPARFVASGSITATPIPGPSTLALLIGALGMFGAVRRTKRG